MSLRHRLSLAAASLAFAAAGALAQQPWQLLSPPQPTEGGGKVENLQSCELVPNLPDRWRYEEGLEFDAPLPDAVIVYAFVAVLLQTQTFCAFDAAVLGSWFANDTSLSPVMRALFDNGEIRRRSERFPDFRELCGQQFAEERSHADVGKIISAPPDRASTGAVIAMLRMIQRLLHEPGE